MSKIGIDRRQMADSGWLMAERNWNRDGLYTGWAETPKGHLAKVLANFVANSEQTFARVYLTFGLGMSTLLADEQLLVVSSRPVRIDFPGLPRQAYLDRWRTARHGASAAMDTRRNRFAFSLLVGSADRGAIAPGTS
jgi:hypothetical protein